MPSISVKAGIYIGEAVVAVKPGKSNSKNGCPLRGNDGCRIGYFLFESAILCQTGFTRNAVGNRA